MTNRIARAVGAGLLTMALGTSAANAAVTIAKDAGVTTSIPGLTGFATLGSEMGGMTVQAQFSGGTNEVRTWTVGAGSSGGVTGTGWALSLDGNSFVDPWNFTISSSNLGTLVRLTLNAIPGRTAFDTTDNNLPPDGTPNSAGGKDFEVNSGCDFCVITARYSNELLPPGYVAGEFFDLFGTLTIDFGTDLGPRTSFSFLQDTDSISEGDIGPPTTTVPEPTSLALLGGALALVGLSRRRKTVN